MSWAFEGLEPRTFRALVADPPWVLGMGTKNRPQHYPRMKDREIAALPVADLAHPDGCWLFLWTPSNRLHLVFDIANAWGFRFSARAFVWVKTIASAPDGSPWLRKEEIFTGTGLTTRKNAEDCLLFRRGKPKRLSKNVHEVIIAPRREHSRKPDEAYSRIEEFCAGPYADLFSRESRPGWDCWGNERQKFDAPLVDWHDYDTSIASYQEEPA
jgi:N6-adenosine-specific RNA methylase IME4